jgi:hypothetical protein
MTATCFQALLERWATAVMFNTVSSSSGAIEDSVRLWKAFHRRHPSASRDSVPKSTQIACSHGWWRCCLHCINKFHCSSGHMTWGVSEFPAPNVLPDPLLARITSHSVYDHFSDNSLKVFTKIALWIIQNRLLLDIISCQFLEIVAQPAGVGSLMPCTERSLESIQLSTSDCVSMILAVSLAYLMEYSQL